MIDLKKYALQRRPKGRLKGCTIWETTNKGKRAIAYIKKPKNVSEKDFFKFMDTVQLSVNLFPEE